MDKVKPRLVELHHDVLIPCRYQMRRQFDPDCLQELADSIKANGLLQPIIVRALSDDQYEIVAGERRWRACKLVGMLQVPCLLNVYSDRQVAAAATVENINRVDLNPIEEAQAYKRLVNEFSYAHEEVASIVGKSRSKVTNCLRLLKLAQPVQDHLVAGDLSEGHAKLLLSLDKKKQIMLAAQCVKGQWSVRVLQQEIATTARADDKGLTAAENDPNLARLEKKIALKMGCKVQLTHTSKRTLLALDCHNLEILEGVLEKMNIDVSDM